MSLFPLYDEVIAKMDGSETGLNKCQCATITRLSQEHLNIIYLIILHHHIHNGGSKTEVPYGGKTISNGKGVTFKNLTQVPDDVQKIIHRYLTIVSQ